ncbi:hypothetical protein JB92DRAFT_1654008 [Gautieria morchelliformis]|nr:hypothetical protein JB92DRAFT_1654008 [Gautieria morchelliformis]
MTNRSDHVIVVSRVWSCFASLRVQKPSMPESIATRTDSYASILVLLGDPLEYDDKLVRRLTRMLKNDTVVATKPSVSSKRVPPRTVETSDDRRRFAMSAANAASQCLGTIIQSGWNASSLTMADSWTDKPRPIVACFQLAISTLRELMPRVIDIERVVSSFIAKLITIQLYEVSLELLAGIRMHVIQLYREQPVEPPVRNLPRTIAKPSPLVRYLHLIRYPLPPPKDAALVGVIGTSVSQALTALATLLCHSPGNGALLEAFASTIEEDDGLLMWHTFLTREHADTVLTRAHRALAVAFTSSNALPAVLFRLRTWALRCLLCKTTLDSDMFWTHATNYLALYSKSAIKDDDGVRVVTDVVRFFNALVIMAQGRKDARTFMAGPSFIKFCGIALIFAQRGDDVSNVKCIVQFIKGDKEAAQQSSVDGTLQSVKLYATFSQGSTMLEKSLPSDSDADVVAVLTQCLNAFPLPVSIFSGLQSSANTLRSLEKLRRLCGGVLEERKRGDRLRNVAELILERIVESIEIAMKQLTKPVHTEDGPGSTRHRFHLHSCQI